MPLVMLKYKPDRVLLDMVNQLALALPEIVAKALHAVENEGAHLTDEEVEVWPVASSNSVNAKDIGIIIFANNYLERRWNLPARKDVIVAGVREFLADYDRNLTVSVWPLLAFGAYGEI